MRLPARLEHLPLFLKAIRDSVSPGGFQQTRIAEMELAAEEALVNIISHAYHDEEGPVEIACRWAEEGMFIIEIRDEGPPFDPLTRAVPDVNASLNDRPIGGLGVLIIKNLADRVSYRREQNANILTLAFGAASPAATL